MSTFDFPVYLKNALCCFHSHCSNIIVSCQ